MGNSALKQLWFEVSGLITNAHLIVVPMSKLQPYHRIDLAATCFGACLIYPISADLKPKSRKIRDYFAVIALAEDFILPDIAHELGHLYIHGALGYPFLWDNLLGSGISSEKRLQRSFVTRIYDIAVHPVIDDLLEKRGLLKGVRERMYISFKDTIKKCLKNPSEEESDWVVIRFIEMQHRLDSHHWANLLRKYSERPAFSRILERIQLLPQFPTQLTPASVNDYFHSMVQAYQLRLEDLCFELLFISPLLEPRDLPT